MSSNCVEKLYQACKAVDKIDIEYVLESETPFKAKRRGGIIDIRPDWEEVKVKIMEELLKLKFEIPMLKQKLIETEGMILIEGNYWRDKFWGVCNGAGENNLGELLMKMRQQITNEPLLIFDREEIYGRIQL